MSAQILCCGDIHLGLRPSKTPSSLCEKLQLTLPSALRELCNFAISKDVSALVFSGDVADASNSFFEAYAALKHEVERLLEANIPVIAVAGNHDFDVLAKLAGELPGFHLLGSNGNWETFELDAKDSRGEKVRLKFVGRSFTSRHEHHNPLIDFPNVDLETPTIGLLHCDVDQPSSAYAPVALSALKEHNLSAWVLGHIHKPTIFNSPAPIFYPGTLQGLDPGETGAHGAWLLSIDEDLQANVTPIPLAPLRYEALEMEISDAADIAEVQREIVRGIESWYKQHEADLEHTRAVAARITLVGESKLANQPSEIENSLHSEAEFIVGDVTFFVEKLILNIRPPISLETLADSSDLPGLLAKKLLVIRDRAPEAEYRHFISETTGLLAQCRTHPTLNERLVEVNQEETVRQELLRSGNILLGRLLQQPGDQ